MNIKKIETRVRKSTTHCYWYAEYRVVWFSIFTSEWNEIWFHEGNNLEKICESFEEACNLIDDFIARGYTLIDTEPQITKYP